MDFRQNEGGGFCFASSQGDSLSPMKISKRWLYLGFFKWELLQQYVDGVASSFCGWHINIIEWFEIISSLNVNLSKLELVPVGDVPHLMKPTLKKEPHPHSTYTCHCAFVWWNLSGWSLYFLCVDPFLILNGIDHQI